MKASIKLSFIALTLTSSIVIFGSNLNTAQAHSMAAFDGTCCKETDALCVIGSSSFDDRFYQSEGACNQIPPDGE